MAQRSRNARTAGSAIFFSLDGLGQDDGGLAAMRQGRRIGGIDLGRVMPAAVQRADLVIRQMGHAFQQHRVCAEEVFAHIGAAACLEHLILAVHALHHAAAQAAVVVLRQERRHGTRFPVPG
ncbi:hypothetical protein G6F68_019530 [Rhizopus microsporus]|nr:hypothetical protein G6F68_019530 [Rhizopus microsporus]